MITWEKKTKLVAFPAVVVSLAVCLWAVPLVAQESGETRDRAPQWGGPNAVENQLRDDAAVDRPSLFEHYFDWKAELVEKHGLSMSIDYSAVYLGASESPGEDRASSGMVRFFGAWDLVGRGTKNTGAFIWKVEHRHAYTDVAPGGFGFNLGYVGLFEPPFSDQGTRLTNLYWRQRFNDGRIALVGGWVDPTDYLDVYALASPWTGFLNFAFSTGTTTIPVPNEGFGLAAGAMITDSIFLIGGLADLNADPTDPGRTLDSFFSDYEYFKHIEIGWTPSHDRIYLDNVHLTLWHADERVEATTPSGWGANFSWSHYISDRWLPFVRAGYASEGGSLMQKSVSVGFGYQRKPGKNLLGVGLNWGEPNENTWEPGLPNQYTAELFFRWQVSKAIAITPDVEYLRNPALNPDTDSLWVFGLRVRGVL
jgi:porin